MKAVAHLAAVVVPVARAVCQGAHTAWTRHVVRRLRSDRRHAQHMWTQRLVSYRTIVPRSAPQLKELRIRFGHQSARIQLPPAHLLLEAGDDGGRSLA